jgi:hypothetical protein
MSPSTGKRTCLRYSLARASLCAALPPGATRGRARPGARVPTSVILAVVATAPWAAKMLRSRVALLRRARRAYGRPSPAPHWGARPVANVPAAAAGESARASWRPAGTPARASQASTSSHCGWTIVNRRRPTALGGGNSAQCPYYAGSARARSSGGPTPGACSPWAPGAGGTRPGWRGGKLK